MLNNYVESADIWDLAMTCHWVRIDLEIMTIHRSPELETNVKCRLVSYTEHLFWGGGLSLFRRCSQCIPVELEGGLLQSFPSPCSVALSSRLYCLPVQILDETMFNFAQMSLERDMNPFLLSSAACKL